MQNSLYWHDYETFGADPKRDRPVQFAGLRTDLDLNIISEPLVIYAKPSDDYLPSPQACLITGITPQLALEKGLPEAEFIRLIHQELAKPGTCGVGYNSLRFDDEVTRFTLYRNFYDAYGREWQNGCSRWDIIDMARICYALRPDGIEWPKQEDGSPSFRLELLTQANGIAHADAHDALSDVHATIGLAKLIRQRQPKLYSYLFSKRDKRSAAELLDLRTQKMVLHTSRMYPAALGCTTLVMPLAIHPVNKNSVIAFDLRYDPQPLIDLEVEQIQRLLFTPADQLDEGEERIALKQIHLNKCPVLAPLGTLDAASQQRLQLDPVLGEQHRQKLLALPGLAHKLALVHASVGLDGGFEESGDPDLLLYGGGFFSGSDKRLMDELRRQPPEKLANYQNSFQDPRMPELLLRYRARNHPETLSFEELQQWQEHRKRRFEGEEGYLGLADYLQKIEILLQSETSPRAQQILAELNDYADLLMKQ